MQKIISEGTRCCNRVIYENNPKIEAAKEIFLKFDGMRCWIVLCLQYMFVVTTENCIVETITLSQLNGLQLTILDGEKMCFCGKNCCLTQNSCENFKIYAFDAVMIDGNQVSGLNYNFRTAMMSKFIASKKNVITRLYDKLKYNYNKNIPHDGNLYLMTDDEYYLTKIVKIVDSPTVDLYLQNGKLYGYNHGFKDVFGGDRLIQLECIEKNEHKRYQHTLSSLQNNQVYSFHVRDYRLKLDLPAIPRPDKKLPNDLRTVLLYLTKPLEC